MWINNAHLETVSQSYHIPVLQKESVDHLVTRPSGTYVDATLGGGGHTEAILQHLDAEGRLFGIDQDDDALKAARERLGEDERITYLKGNFGYLTTLIPPEYHSHIDGILLDLGVSTHQISEPERGFSFQNSGPLDMRMGNFQRLNAYKVVNEYDYYRLRDIIFHYGEEKMSRQIAKAIIENRPIETTDRLAQVVRSVVSHRYPQKTLARVFQGLRIEVNQELEMLRKALYQTAILLKPGGRLVVLAYHSLEDRLAKRFIKTGNTAGKEKKDFYGNKITLMQPVVQGALQPSTQEIEENPAARSARLRVGERTEVAMNDQNR